MKIITVIILLLFTGCTTMPAMDTMNKRAVAMEISYSKVLDLIALHNREGRLSLGQKAKIANLLINFNKARDLAYLALQAGDKGGFDSNIATINTLLIALRALITEPQGRISNGISKRSDTTRYGNYGYQRSFGDTYSVVSC